MKDSNNSLFSQTVNTLMMESGFEWDISEAIIDVFCKQAAKHLEDIKDLLAHNDLEQIARILHTFKGGASTARVKEMAKFAIEAEAAAKNNNPELLCSLVEKLNQLLEELNSGKN